MGDVAQGPGWWLASDGRWYPPELVPSPPTPPGRYPSGPRRRRGPPALAVALFVISETALIALVAIVSYSAGSRAKQTVASPTATTANPGHGPSTNVRSAAPYTIGQTAPTDGLQITVYRATDPFTPTDQLAHANVGDHYVEVDVQVTNPGTSQVVFSSLGGFHLLDSLKHQFDETIVPGVQPSAPDGEIAAGRSIRGFVMFEVPDGTAGLKLRAQGSPSSAGAVFTLT